MISSSSLYHLRRCAASLLLCANLLTATPIPASANTTVSAATHVIYSYSGTTLPSSLKSLAAAGKIGGVILFGDNIDNSTPDAIASLQSAYASSPAYAGVPLLVVTDQEGGEVVRLPGGPSRSEKEIGASSNPTGEATQAGQQAAAALKAYNNNGNLAPVADVFHSPGDFDDQYQRSYSNNSTVAAKCVTAFVGAQQGAGALATAKHFPGLGAAAASQDTDVEPVTINSTLASIRSNDEVPFRAAIEADVDMIMASWALYPALDDVYPSGLSKKWVQDELRGRLGFKGVTITDAIEAGALNGFGVNDGYRAVLASVAGMDLILAAAQNVSQGEAIVDALVSAIGNGTIDSDTFEAASRRILKMRRKIAT